MNKTFRLQAFAAPDNMTGETEIATAVREIDFVTSFSKSIKDLLNIMGVSRMVQKQNGTALKKKTATGTLLSGEVTEGDEIPLSQFSVSETVFDTISIEKYRKGVSLEAIAEHGYDNAISLTDEELKVQLRDVVMGRFYNFLGGGTLIATESNWQRAIAKAIGSVKNKFNTMHKTATGVVVWVNTLDLYDYLGTAPITVQNTFGLDYIENFLGADKVFVTSDVAQGTVIATPTNNIVAYYVNPGDSEFAKAGLAYTTDSDTGFIGFHTGGAYDRALSEVYAIMGLRIFAEYVDGIAVVSIDASEAAEQAPIPVVIVEGEVPQSV